MPDIEEYDIRLWFVKTDIEQAEDTFRVVKGILQARREAQPVKKERKRRKDAGLSRVAVEPGGTRQTGKEG